MNSPLHNGGFTLSNKEWGIACYIYQPTYISKRSWLGYSKLVMIGEYKWGFSHITWYKTKRSQLQALEDLIKLYPKLKFYPFRNNYKDLNRLPKTI